MKTREGAYMRVCARRLQNARIYKKTPECSRMRVRKLQKGTECAYVPENSNRECAYMRVYGRTLENTILCASCEKTREYLRMCVYARICKKTRECSRLHAYPHICEKRILENERTCAYMPASAAYAAVLA